MLHKRGVVTGVAAVCDQIRSEGPGVLGVLWAVSILTFALWKLTGHHTLSTLSGGVVFQESRLFWIFEIILFKPSWNYSHYCFWKC